jgi:hypothetical protein
MDDRKAVLSGARPHGATLLAWWRRLRADMQLYPDGHALAGNFRAEQLQAVLRLTPLTMLANLVNASLICITFWRSSPPALLAGWGALVLLAIAQGARAWRRGRQRAVA